MRTHALACVSVRVCACMGGGRKKKVYKCDFIKMSVQPSGFPNARVSKC